MHNPQEWIPGWKWEPGKLPGYASRTRGSRLSKKNPPRNYFDIPCALDIETSHVEGVDHAYIYHWQMQIGLDTRTIWGNTADDLQAFLRKLANYADPDKRETWCIYVHNLSYEFCWLKGIYRFDNEEVFALAPRKICKCTLLDKRLEFRCSYILTNQSLGSWTKKMGVQHKKLDSEEYDHSRVRLPWEELTDEELQYCRNDVLGLCEALTVQMARDNDTLATIPLTSTGYVRRDSKRAMQNYSRWAIRKMQPDEQLHRALVEAFRGGDTHANRYYAGAILDGVRSCDRSSSYPDVICNCRFPMSRFIRQPRHNLAEIRRLKQLDRAMLIRCRLRNVRLRDPSFRGSRAQSEQVPGCD